ncbi:hypothetical protein V499_04273 [Pseudogymnoascus sp. VKM F-103]|uniref:Uncharacterized protein n=1 Tax=Pseudogymnoascus verrucosus TaxID=342668 RepID=A0A1B8GSK5_9PEZI|nr:uncharacterized protein VE01_03362 [Pseudogymnoascus verrucosus]KFY75768.1 hypothetical protein V499_04273 [Pseudogymnoascus sp. VKM F-103]OBT98823.2 hypothetical protein VE01_03362 [Pseudogymnoascus verrucosus]
MPPILGLRQASANPSFLSILRSLVFTYPVTQELLTSSTFKLINPRNHVIVTDQVSVRLPASSISGLSDEAVLALFTRGFFGGKVFAIERLYMKLGGWKTIPTGYSGFKSLPTERIEWNHHNIPAMSFMPVGDILFGAFQLVDSHLKLAPSDPLPSYLDFGFGSDRGYFAGCHRFSLHRGLESEKDSELGSLNVAGTASDADMLEDGEVEVRLEHFRCNPSKNVPSWAECISWFHCWYAKFLFADGISSVLKR